MKMEKEKNHRRWKRKLRKMEKEKEFKLSEKIKGFGRFRNKVNKGYIDEEDIKEFIKRLKEEAWNIHHINKENGLKSGVSEKLRNEIIDLVEGCMYEMCNKIDKLTGDLK